MLDVDFDNYSTDAVAYEWILGDGATTYLTEIYYSYAKTGDCAYFPTLVAYNDFGCTDSATKPVLIPFDMEIFAPNDVYQFIYKSRLKCRIEDYQKVGHVA